MKQSAMYIIEELRNNGYEAFLVGGCVRDMLLGKIPNDWDICTEALPEKVLQIFEKNHTVFKKGIKHGTVGVIVNEGIFEITTYRIDKEYSDHRRPSKVEFTSSLKEDLKRRDFTINAMAFGLDGEIVDYFSGKEDLDKKLIRAVGNPEERFEEDALRILRAVRFSVQLNFKIEEKTAKAIESKKHLLEKISADRKREELNKMLISEVPSRGIRLMHELDILKYIIPELESGVGFEQKSPFHDKTVFEHTMDVLDSTDPILILRLSALLHDIAKPQTFSVDDRGIGHFYGHNSLGAVMTYDILKRLNYSKSDRREASDLVKYHMSVHDMQTKASVKRLIRKIGQETIEILIMLYYADKCSTLDKSNSEPGENFERIFNEIINSKEPMSLKDLEISGNDLMDMGFEKGPVIGEVLNKLFESVLENPENNNREKLLELAKRYYSEY